VANPATNVRPADTPSAEALIDKARSMIPLLQRNGPGHDEAKRISDEVAMQLRQAGFFRICQSTENGGRASRSPSLKE